MVSIPESYFICLTESNPKSRIKNHVTRSTEKAAIAYFLPLSNGKATLENGTPEATKSLQLAPNGFLYNLQSRGLRSVVGHIQFSPQIQLSPLHRVLLRTRNPTPDSADPGWTRSPHALGTYHCPLPRITQLSTHVPTAFGVRYPVNRPRRYRALCDLPSKGATGSDLYIEAPPWLALRRSALTPLKGPFWVWGRNQRPQRTPLRRCSSSSAVYCCCSARNECPSLRSQLWIPNGPSCMFCPDPGGPGACTLRRSHALLAGLCVTSEC
nr:uncharacterized protein LOC112284985 [Physcomitrium patens]|eukprot:XP_024381181.1 uncharacterized protein LOC112284985 [Physcomitrella patens]